MLRSSKEKLEWADLELIVEKIAVHESHIESHLKADIDAVFQSGRLLPEPSYPSQLHVALHGMRLTVDSSYPADKLSMLLRELARPC